MGKLGLKLLFLMASILPSLPAQAEVFLHAFNWPYREVADRAQEIAELGYDAVLIMPPLKSEGGFWWARYQPQDYRVIDNPLGNKADLKAAIDALAANGVKLIADIVLNHMANESNSRSDLNYPGGRVLFNYESNRGYFEENKLFGKLDQNLFSSFDFNDNPCIVNYLDAQEVRDGRICGGYGDRGLPDLKYNDWVVEKQTLYLQSLLDLGVWGFRIDAAKHLPTEQVLSVLDNLDKDIFVFSEIITYGGDDSIEYKLFLGPYLENTNHSVYDFPLLAKLRNVLRGSEGMQGLIRPQVKGQAIEESRAVTMATNHDTANNPFDYFVMTPAEESLAYAYVLGNGSARPLVYSESRDPGRDRWKDLHKREDIVQMIRFRKQLSDEPLTYLYADSCFLVFRRGQKGLVAMNKCKSFESRSFPTRDWPVDPAELNSLISSDSDIRIEGETVTIGLASQAYQFWLKK